MKDRTTYDKNREPELTKPGASGMKFDDSNPWRKEKKDKDKEYDENNPNYFFIVPWQMF